jgi:hypothetical protein
MMQYCFVDHQLHHYLIFSVLRRFPACKQQKEFYHVDFS